MRLIDTSAWIEWISGSPLDRKIIPLLPETADWLVPTIVQFELAKWVARTPMAEQRGDELLAFSSQCVVVPLSTQIAVTAAQYGRDHHLAVADAIIYASARSVGADIVTCDGHFEGLADVIYLAKRPSQKSTQPD
jgi:predicted nucleic acid-binding protein